MRLLLITAIVQVFANPLENNKVAPELVGLGFFNIFSHMERLLLCSLKSSEKLL